MIFVFMGDPRAQPSKQLIEQRASRGEQSAESPTEMAKYPKNLARAKSGIVIDEATKLEHSPTKAMLPKSENQEKSDLGSNGYYEIKCINGCYYKYYRWRQSGKLRSKYMGRAEIGVSQK
jgi:hypothetical protein